MSILGIIILIIIGGIIYAFRDQLLAAAMYIGFFMGVGALIGWWLFDNASSGATVGFWAAIFFGIRHITMAMGAEYSSIFEYAYYFLSIPIWGLNRLQLILTEPWRYMFKTSWPSEGTKELLRPILYFLQLVLYIVTTPLRTLNAFIYNVLVYGTTEIYDLVCEVFHPTNWNDHIKGLDWLIGVPYRFFKYPVYHGFLTLAEGAVWTVIDTVIPAITLYHGTDLTAGRAITKKNVRAWTEGTFTASKSSWGGIGVYFATRRSVARRYAEDPYRLSDSNPVMIVCRVSLGKIINYSLSPFFIYINAGANGNPAVLNKYAEKEGYTTGEWWNQRGGYWEYCLFDWQNRYNHPWRIRPVFVFNFRTGMAQHIDGGLRHWLFSKVVIDDIMRNIWFLILVIIAFVVVIWFALYGWRVLWDGYLWYYFI